MSAESDLTPDPAEDDAAPAVNGDADDLSVAAPNPVNRALIVALGAAGLLIVALLVGLLAVSSDKAEVQDRFDELAAEQRAEADALVVAEQFLTSFVNFDHTTIDADFDRIISYAAGEFLLEVDSFNDPEVRRGIREREVQSRGEIVNLFVQSVENDRARVFAVVDQTIQNNEPNLTNDELRMEIGLIREDGIWKIFDVALLEAQSSIGNSQIDLPAVPPVTAAPVTTTTALPG